MRHSKQAAAALVWSLPAVAYGALACILTWPLPRNLQTSLLGDPSGDLGVYVWNLWIFRHELIRHAHLPFSTGHVFAYSGGADFSLHNYAPIAGALGAPLIGVLGVVGAFNVVLLTVITLTGLSTFLLARRLELGRVAAWCAGALFMASPVLTAKETAHFSLVIVAALPLFLCALLRALETGRTRDAIMVGVTVAAASYSDAYYGIYCAMMGAFVVAWRFGRVEWPVRPPEWPRATVILNALIATLGSLVVWCVASPSTWIVVGPVHVALQTLYTPLLMLVMAAAMRLWIAWQPTLHAHDPEARVKGLVRLGLTAVAACIALLLPPLVGIALRFLAGRLPDTEIYWRSSPRGVDALAYLVPNPNHAWFGDLTRLWFMPNQQDAFPEFVGSFPLTALALIGVAGWLRLLPRFWIAFTGVFAALSLGPFIHVAGVNTYVIGPWALLRYVPVVGMARSPSRFAVVAALGLCLLFAFALEALRRRHAGHRWIEGLVAATLAIELLPAPRVLYSAAVPDVYRLIAATTTAEESGRLLELPTGIRDGTSSLGDFSASSEYFQTMHRRPLIGGYLSRISRWRKTQNERAPMLRVLFALSEGRDVPRWRLDEARQSRNDFLAYSCVKFVIVNKRRTSMALQNFASDALGLILIHEDDGYALLTPADAPACESASEHGN